LMNFSAVSGEFFPLCGRNLMAPIIWALLPCGAGNSPCILLGCRPRLFFLLSPFLPPPPFLTDTEGPKKGLVLANSIVSAGGRHCSLPDTPITSHYLFPCPPKGLFPYWPSGKLLLLGAFATKGLWLFAAIFQRFIFLDFPPSSLSKFWFAHCFPFYRKCFSYEPRETPPNDSLVLPPLPASSSRAETLASLLGDRVIVETFQLLTLPASPLSSPPFSPCINGVNQGCNRHFAFFCESPSTDANSSCPRFAFFPVEPVLALDRFPYAGDQSLAGAVDLPHQLMELLSDPPRSHLFACPPY